MIQVGANIQKADLTHGNTPMHVACKHGHLEIVKYMTNLGDEEKNAQAINMFTTVKNKAGQTPYEISEELNLHFLTEHHGIY